MSSQSINHRIARVTQGTRTTRTSGTCRRSRGSRGSRRPATVLVFVLALLGILFVMGISFVTLTQFESKSIASERSRSRARLGADALFQEMGQVLQEGLGGPLSLSGVGDERVAFAEMPGVQNTFSPIEPYAFNGNTDDPYFLWITDLEARAMGDDTGVHLRTLLDLNGDQILDGLPTFWENGFPEFPNGVRVLPADADGDGVVDSLAVDVRDLDLFSDSQMAVLAPALNADSNSAGAVYLAVRIVPHGGLVDLNHAHPSLIKEALNLNYLDGVDPVDPKGTIYHRPSMEHIGYAPALEEVGLRRRNLLPSRSLAPSALMGNPFLDRDSFTYGDGDMYTILLNPGPASGLLAYQSVYDDDHRYWPIDPFEPFNPGNPDNLPSLWSVRMEPGASYLEDNSFDEYDQRHLVTTVSHDDLLSRGADVSFGNDDAQFPVVATRDLLDMMTTANLVEWGGSPDECRTGENSPPGAYTASPWFELPSYPHTLPDGFKSNGDPTSWCDCVSPLVEEECRLNARKGRLRLSLPWLDQALAFGGVFSGDTDEEKAVGLERAHRLVQEVFTMLLLHARNESSAPGVSVTETWGNEQTLGGQTFWAPDHEAISFAAASLTANLFDYMDDDDVPTRIVMRSSDFAPLFCNGVGAICANVDAGACLADGFCERNAAAGTPLLDAFGEPRYVYGIEAQPYITEIATVTADQNPPPGSNPGDIIGFGIELFNPYPNAIFMDDYSIVTLDPMDGSTIDSVWSVDNDSRNIKMLGTLSSIPSGAFRALNRDDSKRLLNQSRRQGQSAKLIDVASTVPPNFIHNGWHIYLVREVDADNDPNTPLDRIVVDEFAVDGSLIGLPTSPPPPVDDIRSIERDNVSSDNLVAGEGPWYAPVPASSDDFGGESLGKNNITNDPDTAMVEAVVGDPGLFASAFPTTGSMLMVMRYANRDSTEFNYDASKVIDPLAPLAFTARLDETVNVNLGGASVPIRTRTQVDNGRMPVFDAAGANRRLAGVTPLDEPGDLQRLPWGQLLFDYFTALPLSNLGPYEFNGESGPGACCTGSSCFGASGESECDDAGGVFAGPGTDCLDVTCGILRDQPKVDLDGLRVHGRININAAPWKVLAGLPMVRAAAFDFLPAGTKDKVVNALGLGAEAEPIGAEVAEAIVAYRELRELTDLAGAGVTGNYNLTRGWTQNVSQRRGSGFMSVGELANVQNTSGGPDFQIFPSGLTLGDKDFVSYASRLMAMGDWVSARSHVFTVYGLLLGDEDQTITVPGDDTKTQQLRTEDVLSRAVRFQETLDRLPTFTGEPLPRRIGERVLVGYTDTQND